MSSAEEIAAMTAALYGDNRGWSHLDPRGMAVEKMRSAVPC